MILRKGSLRRPSRKRSYRESVNGFRLHLPVPVAASRGWLWSGLVFAAASVVLFHGRKVPVKVADVEERVDILPEDIPPPPPMVEPPQVELAAPRPAPAPQPQSPPAPPDAEPPKPVFGMDEDQQSENGEMAVATGNSLAVKSDSIVPEPVAARPPAPIELDRPPSVVKRVVPEYPYWAEQQGVTAKVQLKVAIDAHGEVYQVQIQRSGGKDFDTNAIKAVRSTFFQPLVRQGQAVSSQFIMTYEFIL